MKKPLLLILLFLTILFIAGCKERSLTFDRTYPDLTRINAILAEQEALSKSENPYDFLIESNYKPDYVWFTPSTGNQMDQYTAEPFQFCWRENWEDCDHLQVVNAHEDRFFYTAPYTYQRGTKVRFSVKSEIKQSRPSPDEVMIYEQLKDGSLIPIEITQTDTYKYEMELPEDQLPHIYIGKLIFKEDVGGVSYFFFEIRVKD
jgi:hypothetical protein